MIRFGCPMCKSSLQARDQDAGAKFACPKCGQRLQIPIRRRQAKPCLANPCPRRRRRCWAHRNRKSMWPWRKAPCRRYPGRREERRVRTVRWWYRFRENCGEPGFAVRGAEETLKFPRPTGRAHRALCKEQVPLKSTRTGPDRAGDGAEEEIPLSGAWSVPCSLSFSAVLRFCFVRRFSGWPGWFSVSSGRHCPTTKQRALSASSCLCSAPFWE